MTFPVETWCLCLQKLRLCNLLEPAFRGKGCKSLRVNREPVTTKKNKKSFSVNINHCCSQRDSCDSRLRVAVRHGRLHYLEQGRRQIIVLPFYVDDGILIIPLRHAVGLIITVSSVVVRPWFESSVGDSAATTKKKKRKKNNTLCLWLSQFKSGHIWIHKHRIRSITSFGLQGI